MTGRKTYHWHFLAALLLALALAACTPIESSRKGYRDAQLRREFDRIDRIMREKCAPGSLEIECTTTPNSWTRPSCTGRCRP